MRQWSLRRTASGFIETGGSTAAILALALGAAVATTARAQSYPKAPIQVVIAAAPGDAGDLVARAVGASLAAQLGATLTPVNRPGAGGSVATQSVLNARRDGYTILLATNSAVTFRPAMDPQDVGYDVGRDLVPLGLVARNPTVLVVRADAPYRDLRELVASSRAKTGAVHVGSAGAGSSGDLCLQVLAAATGAEPVHVPFKGASPALTALLGAHLEGAFLALGTLHGPLHNGTVRAIVSSSQIADLPSVPTLSGAGYGAALFDIWYAFFAPAGVGPEVSRALVPAIAQAAADPAVVAKYRHLGIQPNYLSPAGLLAEIEDERRRLERFVRPSGAAPK